MNRQILKFEINKPVTVALEFPDGLNVPGNYGPQVKFSLTEQRVMFVPPDVADAIRKLGVLPGERFTVTKRKEPGRAMWWDLEKIKERRFNPILDDEPVRSTAIPPETQPARVSPARPALLAGEVKRIPPQPAQISPPPASGMHLAKTPPLKPSYEEAFRECLRIVREGLHDAGEAWSDHSVQAMTSTLFIQAAREGRVQFTVPRVEKVA